jgi:hypothetical protein
VGVAHDGCEVVRCFRALQDSGVLGGEVEFDLGFGGE